MDVLEQAQDDGSTTPQPTEAGSVWSRLREAREAHGMTVAEVARYLKLTPRQIEAMEAGDLSHLPEVTFARGFIRNYARLLKLDPQPLLAGLEPPREAILAAQPARLGQMPGPRAARFSAWPAAAICLALFLLLCAAWYYGWFEPRDEQTLADVVAQSEQAAVPPAPIELSAPAASIVGVEVSAPVSEASMPAAQSEPVAVAVPASAPLAASSQPLAQPAASVPAAVPVAVSAPTLQAGQVRLVFSFDVEAWVEVRDAGNRIIFSRLNQPGSTQEVLGGGPLSLVIGNASGVKLVANGRPVELAPHTKVNVARLTLP